jgi:hypothetical protein
VVLLAFSALPPRDPARSLPSAHLRGAGTFGGGGRSGDDSGGGGDGGNHDIYSVVIDAGSTGSRIHVLKFKRDAATRQLQLVKTGFKALKPGLSAYRDEPQKAGESLRPLLETAMADVPEGRRAVTGLSLKATAGLRLLPGRKADEILKVKAFGCADNGLRELGHAAGCPWACVCHVSAYVYV